MKDTGAVLTNIVAPNTTKQGRITAARLCLQQQQQQQQQRAISICCENSTIIPLKTVKCAFRTLMVEEEQGKYRCTTCSKLFKGDEYVIKHIRNKHMDLVPTIDREVIMWSNYLRDIHRPSYASFNRALAGGYGSNISLSHQSTYASTTTSMGQYAGGRYGDHGGGGGHGRGSRQPRYHPYARSGGHQDDAPTVPYNKNGRTISQTYHDLDALYDASTAPLSSANAGASDKTAMADREKTSSASLAPVAAALLGGNAAQQAADDPFAAISYD